jgi:hypothetical protein
VRATHDTRAGMLLHKSSWLSRRDASSQVVVALEPLQAAHPVPFFEAPLLVTAPPFAHVQRHCRHERQHAHSAGSCSRRPPHARSDQEPSLLSLHTCASDLVSAPQCRQYYRNEMVAGMLRPPALSGKHMFALYGVRARARFISRSVLQSTSAMKASVACTWFRRKFARTLLLSDLDLSDLKLGGLLPFSVSVPSTLTLRLGGGLATHHGVRAVTHHTTHIFSPLTCVCY